MGSEELWARCPGVEDEQGWSRSEPAVVDRVAFVYRNPYDRGACFVGYHNPYEAGDWWPDYPYGEPVEAEDRDVA